MDFLHIAFFVLVIIPSAILHEWAHAVAADKLGDPTPKLSGRLTLNPIPHIDPWGTILLPLLLSVLTRGAFLFAYAKPVPFNPLALKWQRWGAAAVGVAGPLANLIIAFGLGLVMRLVPESNFSALLSVIVYANVLLAVFNLVPIPPLDGSHVLFAALPDKWYTFKTWLTQWGYAILIFFLLFLFDWLYPVIDFIFRLATGQYLLG